MDNPRIYVASLSDYNAGRLYGVWIDLDMNTTPEDIQGVINAMLARSTESPAEEYAIHDREGFEGWRVTEHEDLAYLCAIAALPDGDRDVIGQLHSHLGFKDTAGGVEEARQYFEDNFAGNARTLEDWAEEWVHESGEDIPEKWAPYIDWEKYARDLELGGDIFAIAGGDGVLVFWNR